MRKHKQYKVSDNRHVNKTIQILLVCLTVVGFMRGIWLGLCFLVIDGCLVMGLQMLTNRQQEMTDLQRELNMVKRRKETLEYERGIYDSRHE